MKAIEKRMDDLKNAIWARVTSLQTKLEKSENDLKECKAAYKILASRMQRDVNY